MLTINECYLEFVDKILKQGKETYKDSNHHLIESLGNFYIIDDPFNLKFRAKYQHYTTEMLLSDIKNGKFDVEGCPMKSDALYEYVKSAENPDDQGFVYTYPNRIYAHFDIDQFNLAGIRLGYLIQHAYVPHGRAAFFHMPALADDGFGEALEGGLVGHVADKPLPGLDVDDVDRSPAPAEGVGDRPAYALRAAGDDGDFSFKGIHYYPPVIVGASQQPFQRRGDAVFIVRQRDHVRRRLHILAGVPHGDAHARGPEHLDVVLRIAERDGLAHVDARAAAGGAEALALVHRRGDHLQIEGRGLDHGQLRREKRRDGRLGLPEQARIYRHEDLAGREGQALRQIGQNGARHTIVPAFVLDHISVRVLDVKLLPVVQNRRDGEAFQFAQYGFGLLQLHRASGETLSRSSLHNQAAVIGHQQAVVGGQVECVPLLVQAGEGTGGRQQKTDTPRLGGEERLERGCVDRLLIVVQCAIQIHGDELVGHVDILPL